MTSMGQKAQFMKRLEGGCSCCDFDEAECGLVDHCSACCHWLTTEAYDLFVIQMEWPEGYDALRASQSQKRDEHG